MENGKLKISVLLLFAAVTTLHADLLLNAPIQNLKIPTFDTNGRRTRLMTGREALYLNANEIKITDLEITLYATDGTGKILTTLASPEALVKLEDKKLNARGPDLIRIQYQNLLELTGHDWTYDHAQQKITLNRDVRVTYQISLPQLLK